MTVFAVRFPSAHCNISAMKVTTSKLYIRTNICQIPSNDICIYLLYKTWGRPRRAENMTVVWSCAPSTGTNWRFATLLLASRLSGCVCTVFLHLFVTWHLPRSKPKHFNGPLGKLRHRWEHNIKMDLREMGWEDVDWIHTIKDSDWCWAVVNTVMDMRVL
jgi:hypothetical protein